MVKHIKFCLEEIEAEIEALDGAIISVRDRASLGLHIAGMRLVLDGLAEGGKDLPAEKAISPVLTASAPTAVEAATLQSPGDPLALIRGVTTADHVMLARHGITSFAAIAQWRRADIEKLDGGKALFQRIAREGWIEQAALLADGKMTAHARAISDASIDKTAAKPLPPAEMIADDLLPIETPAAPALQVAEPVAKHAPTLAKRLEASRRGVPYRQVAATLFLFVMAGAGIAGMTQMPDVMMNAPTLAMLGEIAFNATW